MEAPQAVPPREAARLKDLKLDGEELLSFNAPGECPLQGTYWTGAGEAQGGGSCFPNMAGAQLSKGENKRLTGQIEELGRPRPVVVVTGSQRVVPVLCVLPRVVIKAVVKLQLVSCCGLTI